MHGKTPTFINTTGCPSLRIILWWSSACRSIMPMCREMATIHGYNIHVILEKKLALSRQQMGWHPDLPGTANYTILKEKNNGR